MLVATVLTTALITGAARGVEAAQPLPSSESVARRIVSKLTSSLRQSIPSARLAPMRISGIAAAPMAILPDSIEVPLVPFEASPLQYPTPPPVL
jgi:hypothetical protein